MGLETNTDKTKLMLCECGYIPTKLSDQAYFRRATGTGPTHREQRRTRVNCPDCNKELTNGTLPHHRQRIHGIDQYTTLQPAVSGPPTTYQVDFPPRSTVPCPVPASPGSCSSRTALRLHLMTWHQAHFLCIQQEGNTPLP